MGAALFTDELEDHVLCTQLGAGIDFNDVVTVNVQVYQSPFEGQEETRRHVSPFTFSPSELCGDLNLLILIICAHAGLPLSKELEPD